MSQHVGPRKAGITLGGVVEFLPGRQSTSAIEQTLRQEGHEPRNLQAGDVCKQSCVYTQHPGSTGHVLGGGYRWLSAVGSRVASGRAIVARVGVRMPR